MKIIRTIFSIGFLLLPFASVAVAADIDVTKYEVEIEPHWADRSVTGRVSITFRAAVNNLTQVEFNDGALTIDAVRDKNGKPLVFDNREGHLRIILSRAVSVGKTVTVEIVYHGVPKYGMKFFPEHQQVYTEFSTSQWMPCVDAPSDRAQFRLRLITPKDLKVVGNGDLIDTTALDNKRTATVWEQRNPVPTYIFGFAVGDLREVLRVHRGVTLRYLVLPSFTESEIDRIFHDTADELDFYEEHAGVKYPYRRYTQVIADGGTEQEMAGFTVIDDDYGHGILKDEHENWLGAHEFAHQWWGNQVTNIDWTHFWLNEGMANFMVAVYKEHRFGHEDYVKEIDKLRTRYEKVRDAGKDKSLVFPDWNHPSREDRSIVYNKGGYVLSLLRTEMGDAAFWRGLKIYTQTNWGRSVQTADFQHAMEKSAKRSLATFFDKWVYGPVA